MYVCVCVGSGFWLLRSFDLRARDDHAIAAANLDHHRGTDCRHEDTQPDARRHLQGVCVPARACACECVCFSDSVCSRWW
jgi:hypothetical protein